jgi:ABC-type Fe3+-hydroxamate transport system substrate-binding protein
VDDLARPLLLGARVQRIVSLAPSCTECLLAIGAGERPVGIDDHSDFPERLTGVVRAGGFKDLDLVRVTDLAPDLVVAASLHAVSFLPRLETQGTRVFVMMPRTVDGIVDGMARLASVLGLAAEAAPYLASCRTRIATVVDRTLPEGHTGGPQSFLDDLVVKAGGVKLGGALPGSNGRCWRRQRCAVSIPTRS